MSDLLPCPFCGGKAEAGIYGGSDVIWCPNDDCEALMGGEEYAGDGNRLHRCWNTRAALSAPAPQGIGREEIARVIAQHRTALDQNRAVESGCDVFLIASVCGHDLDLADAILALLPTEPPAQWQSIETAPRDGWEILISWAGGDVAVGWFETSRGHFNWHEASRPKSMQPTHWMRLPTPPVQVGADDHDNIC